MMSEEYYTMDEPTQEEKDEAVAEFASLMKWACSLSDRQKSFLMDGGWYNNAMKGYLIAAARNADFTEQQISDLLRGLSLAFSEHDKREAEQIYLKG